MDNKNVFIAIALSMSVLLFWAAFFETPRQSTNNVDNPKKQQTTTNNITPSITENIKIKELSREESIKNTKRIKIENENIVGSLSLTGALIDDISFKKHKQNLKNNKNIEFLNPSETTEGFYVETGWTSINNLVNVPTKNTVWSVKGNNILSVNQPVVLQWNNDKGIIFKKIIELDNKYLFRITQEVQNNTKKNIEFRYIILSRIVERVKLETLVTPMNETMNIEV